MKKLIIIQFVCLLMQNAFAGTIYISTSGNDATGNGSAGNPYATLSKASSMTSNGDVIYFTSGTYTESNQITIPSGVNIDGAGRDLVKVYSTYPASGGAYDYWINLVSATENTNGNQFIRNVTFDGSNTTCFRAIIITARSNVAIYNCRIQNFKLSGVYWRGSLQSYGTEPLNYAVNNTFYNNIVDNCSNRMYPDSVSNGGSGGGLLSISGQQGMQIHDNLLSDTSRTTGRNGNIIFAVEGNLKGLKYYNNKSWSDPNVSTVTPSPWNIALEFWNCRGGMEFYNNEFYGGAAIDQGGLIEVKGTYDYSFWIHDNTFIRKVPKASNGSRDDGAWVAEGIVQDAIFERNRVIGLSNNAVAITIGYTSDKNSHNITIRNNLFQNIGVINQSPSVYALQIGMPRQATNQRDTIQDVYIYNNTFVNSTSNKVSGNIMMGNDTTLNLVKRIFIRNNIIDDASSYGYLTFYEAQNSITPGLIDSVFVDHNIIYNNGNSNNAFYRGNRNTTNTKLYETNSIHSDPLLNPDFTFQYPSSPAFEGGVNVGYPYTGTAPDIGAFGYVVANAGSNQTVYTSGGTASIIVGSSSIGALSWLWKDISAEGKPSSIINPTASSTSIVGLVPGVYTFQLAAYSGLAVSYDNIVVNVLPAISTGAVQIRGRILKSVN